MLRSFLAERNCAHSQQQLTIVCDEWNGIGDFLMWENHLRRDVDSVVTEDHSSIVSKPVNQRQREILLSNMPTDIVRVLDEAEVVLQSVKLSRQWPGPMIYVFVMTRHNVTYSVLLKIHADLYADDSD